MWECFPIPPMVFERLKKISEVRVEVLGDISGIIFPFFM